MEYLEEPEEPEEEFLIEVQQVKPVKPTKALISTSASSKSPKTTIAKPEIVKSETIKILNKLPTPQRPAAPKAYGVAPKQKILNSSKLLNNVYKGDFLDNPTIHQNENGNMEIVTEELNHEVSEVS